MSFREVTTRMVNNNTGIRPLVGVLGGSKSDFPILEKAVAMLNELGIANELLVVSAHLTPDRLFAYAEQASERGIQVIIGGAGGAAHLAGVVAAHTTLPEPRHWKRILKAQTKWRKKIACESSCISPYFYCLQVKSTVKKRIFQEDGHICRFRWQ